MRYYNKRRPQNIIIPIYPAAVFAGDQVQKLGDIKYIYYLDNNNTYAQATGVYAESSGGSITAQAGQAIFTFSPQSNNLYILTLSYNSTISQTIETVQGNYYFVVPAASVFVALEDGTIVATVADYTVSSEISVYGQALLLGTMYGINFQLE